MRAAASETPDSPRRRTSGHHVHGTFRTATATTSGIGTSVLASTAPLAVTAALSGITTLVVDAPGRAWVKL